MIGTLIRKLRQARKRVAKYRRMYPEIARQEKRNVQAIKKQIRILEGR